MSHMQLFREEIRNWLEENCPHSMRTVMPADEHPGGGRRAQYKNPDTKVWLERCAEKGLTVASWPKVYGGAGFDSQQMVIWQQEMRRINARPPHLGMEPPEKHPGVARTGVATAVWPVCHV